MNVHEKGCNDLYQRLQEAGGYNHLYLHLSYTRRGLQGEMDVVGVRDEWAHYYEIKSTNNAKAYQRARMQFLRAFMAFPEYNWQFIYVTADGKALKRYYPDAFKMRRRRTKSPGLIERVHSLSRFGFDERWSRVPRRAVRESA